MALLIKRLTSNSEARRIIENFSWLSLLQLVNYALPLFTLPYLARVIGVSGFGSISFAAAVILWFQAITDWGFNFTATRDVARNRNNISIVSQIFSNVLFARIVLMMICLILMSMMIIVIPVFKSNALILLISFLTIPGHIICPDWFFQGMERMKYISILNVVAKLIFTVAVFIFIKKESDFILQPLFSSLGFLFSGIISFYIITRKWGIKILKPNFSTLWKTLKKSTDVFINNFIPNLYNSLSVVLMGFWGGNIANGKYDAGNKFINIIIQIISVLSRAFFPLLSRNISYHKKYAIINFSIVCILSSLIFIFAPYIIHAFFTSAFDDAIVIMRILACSLPFLSLSNIYGTNYLIIVGKEKQLRNATITASLIGFSIAIPLVYFYTFIGAAVTVAITRLLLGLFVYISAHREHKIIKAKA